MSIPIYLIVGLGNPGINYEMTRHNTGFRMIDIIAKNLDIVFKLKKNFLGYLTEITITDGKLLLFKPITYMNQSGQAVSIISHFFKLNPEKILVIHDELDLMPGQLKIKKGGGHAGHRGVKSIEIALNNSNFWRLRIGIGHPRTLGLSQKITDFVLYPSQKRDQESIEKVISLNCRLISNILTEGFDMVIQKLYSNNKV